MLFVILLLNFVITHTKCECWWTGCQPYTWAVRGCIDSIEWQQVGSKTCTNGDQFYCCRKALSIDTLSSDFITFDEFVAALTSNEYPAPTQDQYRMLVSQARIVGNITTKQEAAMFLAQSMYESDGFIYKKDQACELTGCLGAYVDITCNPSANYYGRGYIQLTWCYNYKQASQDLFGDQRLVMNPDVVSDNDTISWATAYWFWRTKVSIDPNVKNFWFGSTTNAINGAVECLIPNKDSAIQRFDIYKKTLIALNLQVTPIENGCYN